ncbi:hypothetical protein LC605_27645 [Nostoc sp. CHAB 5836]|uniref:hypothetical protein n=1 Tax=Nostoc sp. CHAB 5836 TaxID=2780404 RepID=UPI001E4F512E|nr:hypothetical protein [Nostoc sp. CHAB 5836]MCC5618794.1 hypothetical protein [Nostoc sp. CHAB 5836]
MIDPSDSKEIQRDYLETLESLLKRIFQKAEEKKYNPSKEIFIKVGNERIYRGVPDENMKEINAFISPDLVDNLSKAFQQPEQLKNVVVIKIGGEDVFRVEKGQTTIDKLGLSQVEKQSQKNVIPERVYSVEELQKQVDVLQKKMQSQQKLVDELKSQPQSQSSSAIAELFAQVEEMSKSLEKQQKAIEKTQHSLAAFSQHSLPRIQNTKLQNWVGAIENQVKQTSKNLFDRIKDAVTPEIVKLHNSLDQQMSEMKSLINQQVSDLKDEMQTQIEGVKSQFQTSVNHVRESVDNKISSVKNRAIEDSVKVLLMTLGDKQPDGSIVFKSKNFDFQQLGDSVNVKAKDGANVIKDGVITPSVTPEQITQLEKVKPVVDELLNAEADLSYADAESEYIQAESEYLSDPENLEEIDDENLFRGMGR